MTRVDKGELIGGATVAVVSSYFFLNAFDYQIGSLTRMGPGFLPLALGAIGLALGLIIMLTALGRPGVIPKIPLRPCLFVLASIAVFAFLLERAGLVPASFIAVVISSLGDRTARPVGTIVLATLTSLGNWLVFSLGLGLPMRAFEFSL